MNALATVLAGREEFQSVASDPEFLDSLNIGLMLFGVDGSLIDCNQAAADLCDPNFDHLEELGLSDASPQLLDDDSSVLAYVMPGYTTLRTGEPRLNAICALRQPNGSRLWLNVNSWPFVREDELVGVVLSLEDITESRRTAHLLALHKVVMQSVVETSDEMVALQTFCDEVVKQLDFDSAWIGVTSATEEYGIHVLCASGQVDTVNASEITWSDANVEGRGFVGTALRTGTTQVENSLLTSGRDAPWKQINVNAGFNSGAAIPLKAFNRPGVLCILDSQLNAFEVNTIGQLQILVDEIQYGIAHLGFVRQLNDSLAGTLAALSSMTEIRDPYTAGHQSEVAHLSVAIANSLELEAELILLIGQSGEVHDIGKIGVPAEILTRPGRLTSTEFELIKTHSAVGFGILSSAKLPWPIPQVALEHHERLDGSGYPAGLSRNEICLPARIVAVADVVEAMTHRRPYREALGVESALSEIRGGSGTLYDPDVVRACLKLFEGGYKFKY